MITKAQVKHIRLLEDKKYRIESNQFVVEGDKMVRELLDSDLKIISIYAYSDWIEDNSKLIQNTEITEVSNSELERISSFKTPNKVLAIAELPKRKFDADCSLSILLDEIQDPGNLGSIIRIADWYGISRIYCSESTADCFNHKVIQASMGSIFRTQIEYLDLKQLILSNPNIPTYATTLHGEDINSFNKISKGFIVIGNEGNGIQDEIIKCCQHKITIPSKGKAESLNAAVATGIICHCMLS